MPRAKKDKSTYQKMIECRAAVARAPNTPLSTETIFVLPPEKGEVRIKILYTSVCHTDKYTLDGNDAESNFPCILGHEGAGVVESVGEGVTSVQFGDHVIPLYIPQCRDCQFCRNKRTNLCCKIRESQGLGIMPDGTTRFRDIHGEAIHHYMGTSTFSEFTVVQEISVAKINPRMSLERACLLGCGVSTGIGAVINTADIQRGETVAIFGLGTVGLAVAMGARSRGAGRIIGVDINDYKFEIAKQFGVEEFVNPRWTGLPVQQTLYDMTTGGLDHTFECIGNVSVMEAALESAHKGWGNAVIVGVAAAGEQIKTRPYNLITGRTWTGCAFGGWKSRDDVPKLVELCMASGGMDIEKFITHRKKGIDSVNDVFQLMAGGKCLRCVVNLWAPRDKDE